MAAVLAAPMAAVKAAPMAATRCFRSIFSLLPGRSTALSRCHSAGRSAS